MTQTEYKRPHNAGRRKMTVVALFVLVLCLACFALGIMVGGSGSEEVVNQTPSQTSASAVERKVSGSHPVLTDGEDVGSKQEVRQQKPATLQDQAADLNRTPDVMVEGETPGQIKEVVVQEAPLGSGINPRKKDAATAGDVTESQKIEQVAEPVAQIAVKEPGESPSVSAAEQKENSAPARVAAAKEGKYVVQIASFRAEEDARALAQKLKPAFPAYVRQVDLGEKGIWFRVLVGPLVQRDQAGEVQRRIAESTKLEGFVKRVP